MALLFNTNFLKAPLNFHSSVKQYPNYSSLCVRCSTNQQSESQDAPIKKKRLSEQSSWEAKDDDGNDYLYRLGAEADNMNIAVGARAGVIDSLFAGNFLGKDCIWGGKGQGKSFQTELIFQAMGVEPVIMSAGELESERAGEPGKLIRERYRTASQVVQNQPTQEDIVNIVCRMYEKDGITRDEVATIVSTFPNQALDFYGAMRSRTYDQSIIKYVEDSGGAEDIGRRFLRQRKKGELPVFVPPEQTVEALLESGYSLTKEQKLIMENKLSKEYMKNMDE
ncbi:hypothetical protein RND71_029466 [Anisodus tanguticus]|uniref:Ribulose bisphosphate carboxylase/oxygenase activase, chloroplastic n=1 Tax=Anisodus tanguticus TaxID=243964 RepID=A0AAE1UYS0_9SOLA|nr:hypothetical protein RND71_029466 [Anisodus tanguticus]